MSREEIYRCDVCKKQRGETNHWFLGRFETEAGMYITSWDAGAPDDDDVFHLCGEGCVLRKTSEFVQKSRNI